ncbi:MAG: efflux RND transporter permease subunit, partial [Planctomyces sp.]
QVVAVYPGASAEVLSDTVAGPIEQEINGVENMLYMSSSCSSNGTYTLTVTFEVGTNLDDAQVLVQNRVAVAMPRLPQEVQRQGVTTKKQSTNITLVASLVSPNGTYDDLYLSNFATLRVRDVLTRIPGVGDVQVIGGGTYGMRIWVNPDSLKARQLTLDDVLNAIREQNVQVAAGQIGQSPAPKEQGFQFNVAVQGRLTNPEQFGDIIIRTVSDPQTGMRMIRVRDVARVELGAQVYDQWCEIAGQPAASLLIFQLPGANALSVATEVQKAMEQLSRNFPEGIEAIIPFDTTIFVQESITEVVKTLLEAGFLVLIVILVFLQDWRATLIPATTVPVTIIGAFAVMAALGFSINMLTLFGLVLAIGIVVDDAIVIVENAAHHMESGKLNPKDATIRAMSEVIGPVMGITFVLMAVFVPTAFLGGITGQLYRQFALTIAATAVISAINAVTLKPVQCAAWLRPSSEKKNAFYRGFNAVYGAAEKVYASIVGLAVRRSGFVMFLYAALVAVTSWWFLQLPTGFVPTEDQGYAIIAVQLPDAASQERTREVTRQVNAILKETPGVQSWFLLGGMSLLDNSVASNAATMFITFTPYEDRAGKPELSQDAILG